MSRATRGWYYVDKQGRTVGPKTVSELKPLYAAKAISEKTFIWNGTSVDKWTTIKKVPSIYTQLKQSNASNHSSGSSKLSLLQHIKPPKALRSTKNKPADHHQHDKHVQAAHTKSQSTANTKSSGHGTTNTRKQRSNSKPIPLSSSSSAHALQSQARPLPVAKPNNNNNKTSASSSSSSSSSSKTNSKTKTKSKHNGNANTNGKDAAATNTSSDRESLCQKSKGFRYPHAQPDDVKVDHLLEHKPRAHGQEEKKTTAKQQLAVNHMKASKSLDSLHCADCADHHHHHGKKHGVSSSAAAKKRARQGSSRQHGHQQQASLTVVTKPALRVTRTRGESAVSTESETVSTGFAGGAGGGGSARGAAYHCYTVDPSTPPSTRSAHLLQPYAFTYGQHLAPNNQATSSSNSNGNEIKSFQPHSAMPPRSSMHAHRSHSHDDDEEQHQHEQQQAEQEQHRYSSVSADDIDQILDEIEKNEAKQQELRAKIHRIAQLNKQQMNMNMMTVPNMAGLRHSQSTPAHIERHEQQQEGSQEDDDGVDDEDNYEEDEELKQETLRRTDSGNTTRSAPHGMPSKLIPFKHRSKVGINWDELTAVHFQAENIKAIRKIIGSRSVNINTRNPRDGTTLLMHAIIIGDLELVEEICRVPSINIAVRDNDGDDAIDYALIFQRYKVTHLLLMMKHGLTQKSLARLIERKRREAVFMRHNTFGKFQHSLIQFVVKAIRERKPFDINLLFVAWYFVNHGVDKINGTNPFPDPLNSIFFKAVMKCYAQCTKYKSKNKKDWYWLRRYVIDSILWLLPHPDEQHALYKPDKVKPNMTTFNEEDYLYRDESETSDGEHDGVEFERECSYSMPLSTASFDSQNKDTLPISPTGHAKGDVLAGGGENLLSFLFL